MAVSPEEKIRVIIEWINKNSAEAEAARKQFEKIQTQFEKTKRALKEYSETPAGRLQAFDIGKQIKQLEADYEKNKSAFEGRMEKFKGVEEIDEKLRALTSDFERAKGVLIDYNAPLEDQMEVYNALKEVYADSAQKIASLDPAMRIVFKALLLQAKHAEDAQKKWTKYGEGMTKVGRTIGFYGFIASFSIQRLLTQLMRVESFFAQAVESTSNWTDQLVQNRMAMAYMGSQGLLTAGTITTLNDAYTALQTQGPKVQALWMGLQAQWQTVQIQIATALIPTLQQLLGIIGEMLASDTIRQSIISLTTAFGNLALAIIPVIPTIVSLATWIAIFLRWLQPLYPVLIPLIATIFVLGTALTIIGPLISGLGHLIGVLVKIKTYWAKANEMTTLTLNRMSISIRNVAIAAASLAATLFMFARLSSASAKTLTEDYENMSGKITAGTIDIIDSNGNLIYSINTMTGEVTDAEGNIVGKWNSMTGAISDDKDKIIGYFDNISGKFYEVSNGIATQVGTVKTSLDDFQTKLNGIDFSSLNTSIGEIDSSFDSLQLVLGAVAAVEIVALIAKIASLIGVAGGTTGLLGLTNAIAGTDAAIVPLKLTFSGVVTTLGPVIGILAAAAAACYAVHEAFRLGILPSLDLLNQFKKALGLPVTEEIAPFGEIPMPNAKAYEDYLKKQGIIGTGGTSIAGVDMAKVLGYIQASGIEEAWGGVVKSKQQLSDAMKDTSDIDAMQTALTNLSISLVDYYGISGEALNQADAFAKAMGLSDENARTLNMRIWILTAALKEMSFKHAGPAAMTFGDKLQETIGTVEDASGSIESLSGSLQNVKPPAQLSSMLTQLALYKDSLAATGEATASILNAGLLPAGGVVTAISPLVVTPEAAATPGLITQYITIYLSVSIGTIASNVDANKLLVMINEGIANELQRRKIW